MKFTVRHFFAAGGLCLAALGSHAAGTGEFSVQNGTWAVTSELNGKPGRGMAIDVQDGMLVMQVYNYESSGQPTFHLASGGILDNKFQGTLYRYRGGRYFGSPPLEGVEDARVGNVEIEFSSATTGTIKFPGETTVAISRFKFDGIPANALTVPGTEEDWIVAELDSDNSPRTAWLMTASTSNSTPLITSISLNSASEKTNTEYPCARRDSTIPALGLPIDPYFSCTVEFADSAGGAKIEWRKHLEGMEGSIRHGTDPGTYRLVGMRLLTANSSGIQMDVSSAALPPAPQRFTAPDPGTWAVSSELNGKPGRGMAIDVQGNALVMQVYNYERTGAPTFHLAAGSFNNGQTTTHLKRYEGGRYFGSPALTGIESADVGEVSLSFTSPTTGLVQFPGEPAIAIRRFEFGTSLFSPDTPLFTLFGKWLVLDLVNNKFRSFTINKLSGDAVEGDYSPAGDNRLVKSKVRCSFENTTLGTVRCSDPYSFGGIGPTYYSFDVRFTPLRGRAIGGSVALKSDGQLGTSYNSVYVYHVLQRRDIVSGMLGPIGPGF